MIWKWKKEREQAVKAAKSAVNDLVNLEREVEELKDVLIQCHKERLSGQFEVDRDFVIDIIHYTQIHQEDNKTLIALADGFMMETGQYRLGHSRKGDDSISAATMALTATVIANEVKDQLELTTEVIHPNEFKDARERDEYFKGKEVPEYYSVYLMSTGRNYIWDDQRWKNEG
jgi:hypothetical protein